MKIFAGPLVVLCLLVPAPRAGAQAIVADHTATDVAAIPDAAIASAAALRLLVRHASVGGNIDSGLNALHTANARYDRSLWDFQSRGNPGWQEKVDDLVTQAAAQGASFDVLTMKFCYIDPNASFTYYRDALLGLDRPTRRSGSSGGRSRSRRRGTRTARRSTTSSAPTPRRTGRCSSTLPTSSPTTPRA
jgi:hypothetical protein